MTGPNLISHRPGSRRGLVSVAMLIGLIILGLVAASLLKVGLARRSLAKIEEHERQAELLADSGLSRALARLEANSRFEGEVWEIPSDELGGRGGANVTITVRADPDQPDIRQVVVVSDYRAGSPGSIRLTRTLQMPSSPPVAR